MADRVTVIGSGIVGICTTLSLLEKGLKVEMIDRHPPATGASYGNAGVISPWSCVPQSVPGLWRSVPRWLLDPKGPVALRWRYLPWFLPWMMRFFAAGDKQRLPAIAEAMNALNRPNVKLYRHLLQGTGHEAMVKKSVYVYVYRNADDADLSQLSWRMRAERDVPLQSLDKQELHEIEPELSSKYQAAIIIKNQARALDPGGIGKALAEKAQIMGASFRQTGVDAIVPGGNDRWILQTNQGPLAADKIVIAAGAWSAHLLTPLGFKLPLEAERGYHLVFRNPGITLNNSIMDTERKFVASSMLNGVRCAGTAEFAGLNAPPDNRRARIFKILAKRLFPNINVNDVGEWMGTRPSFPDSLPCIGEVPGHANLFVAFGHSHYGFGMAPNTGCVVADLVNGMVPNIDLTPYRIERFR